MERNSLLPSLRSKFDGTRNSAPIRSRRGCSNRGRPTGVAVDAVGTRKRHGAGTSKVIVRSILRQRSRRDVPVPIRFERTDKVREVALARRVSYETQ
jgi:hypothetical protein